MEGLDLSTKKINFAPSATNSVTVLNLIKRKQYQIKNKRKKRYWAAAKFCLLFTSCCCCCCLNFMLLLRKLLLTPIRLIKLFLKMKIPYNIVRKSWIDFMWLLVEKSC